MERRTSERLAVRLFKRSHENKESYPYRVLNISKVGCALESRAFLGEESRRIVFDLPLPARAESVTLAVRVIWESKCEDRAGAPRYHYGMRFEELDDVSRSILEAYLDFLRRDVHIAKLEEAWGKLKEVQQKIEVLVAFEERKDTSFLH